ncbi:DNA polymerase [alpha proteobacterium AAP81b]|nr:DNA polymerase [alpha proteobacterium AAP81b]
MTVVTLAAPDDFDGFRAAVRGLVGTPPAAVTWQVAGDDAGLFGDAAPAGDAPPLRVPKAFPDLARRVICHRDPERFALLHQALAGLQARPKLLDDAADPLVRRLDMLDKAVRRDVHKMRAYVRFREVPDAEGEHYAAWFEPAHFIVRLNAGFFVRRFASMRFSILTPDLCLHWDGIGAEFTPGASKADAPDGDPLEATWKTYYASIFNPARLKIASMQGHMPKKYWKNLPEAELIPDLIAGAGERTRAMIAAGGADTSAPVAEAPAVAGPKSLAALKAEALGCQRCPLWAPATQTVFGEGPADALVMLVGEQPGDQEDLAGRPFVGPAGQLLDAALAEAGIDRTRAYVTNAVKHFKFEPRGKRRIHAKPELPEIDACRWWLDAERAALKPRIVVALGATAARALTGRAVTIGRERGRAIAQPDGSELWITAHPSFLLRLPDRAAAAAERMRFVADLAAVAARVTAIAQGA